MARTIRRSARWVTIVAIGPDGWAVVERTVDYASQQVVEDAIGAVQAAARGLTGQDATIVVRDGRGRNVSARYLRER
jgi:hypothetical protein